MGTPTSINVPERTILRSDENPGMAASDTQEELDIKRQIQPTPGSLTGQPRSGHEDAGGHLPLARSAIAIYSDPVEEISNLQAELAKKTRQLKKARAEFSRVQVDKMTLRQEVVSALTPFIIFNFLMSRMA